MIKLIKAYRKNRHTYYYCFCTCGEIVIKRDDRIRYVKNCGCNISLISKSKIESLYNRYKNKSYYRGIWFGLSMAQFIYLINQECFYCGDSFSNKISTKTGYYRFNGIDRVNSNDSYVWDNCVPCCKTCNFAKGTLSKEKFINLAVKIACKQKYKE